MKAIRIKLCDTTNIGLCQLFTKCPVNRDFKNCPLPDWPSMSEKEMKDMVLFFMGNPKTYIGAVKIHQILETWKKILRSIGVEIKEGK